MSFMSEGGAKMPVVVAPVAPNPSFRLRVQGANIQFAANYIATVPTALPLASVSNYVAGNGWSVAGSLAPVSTVFEPKDSVSFQNANQSAYTDQISNGPGLTAAYYEIVIVNRKPSQRLVIGFYRNTAVLGNEGSVNFNLDNNSNQWSGLYNDAVYHRLDTLGTLVWVGFDVGDVIGFVYQFTTDTVFVYKNGALQLGMPRPFGGAVPVIGCSAL